MRASAKSFLVCVMIICIVSVPLVLHADTAQMQSQLVLLYQKLIDLLMQELQLLSGTSAASSTEISNQFRAPASDPFAVPPPTCTMSAAPHVLPVGGTALLAWSSQNAITASISDFGPVAMNGSQTITPLVTTHYTGTFTGLSGVATCSASITIGVASSTMPITASSTATTTTASMPHFCPSGGYGYWSFAACSASSTASVY